MTNVIRQVILEYLPILLGTVFTILIGFIRSKFNQYINTETKQKIVQDTVYYVEQLFKDLHGEDKLNKAKDIIIKLLADKGIKFTETELEVLIESTVNQMNLKQEEVNGTFISGVNTNSDIIDSNNPFGSAVPLCTSTMEETNENVNLEEIGNG